MVRALNCLKTIEINMPTYSRSQRTIAQYIVDNSRRALSLSIHEMAEEIGTSASSITRFCRKLGYDSLRDLRNDLATTSDEQAAEDFRTAMQIVGSSERLTSDYLSSVTNVCKMTIDINPMSVFDAAAQALAQADVTYLIGIGSSALAVNNLMNKLAKLKRRCVYTPDADMNAQFVDSATPNDVAISFSYSGYSNDVVKAARNVHANGCPLIVVTHQGTSPLTSLADYALYLPPVEQLTRVTTLFSNYSQSIIVDVLFLLVARKLNINPDELLCEYRSIMEQPENL